MANICENTLQVFSENKENLEYIEKFFDDWDSSIDKEDSCNITVYFSSKWVFPDIEMDELFTGIPVKDDIQMDCLSVEWGCYYCAFHSCDKDGWVSQDY